MHPIISSPKPHKYYTVSPKQNGSHYIYLLLTGCFALKNKTFISSGWSRVLEFLQHLRLNFSQRCTLRCKCMCRAMNSYMFDDIALINEKKKSFKDLN